MGIIGILWIVGIFLKIFGLVAIGWGWVILWPIPLVLILWTLMLALGVTAAGFFSFRRR